jgi:arylsulfatase B
MRTLGLLALGLLSPFSHSQSNILVVIADDLGVDQVGCYSEGQDLPATPVIDGLAAGGVSFRNCWSNPMCSPTRATMQTGRYSFRTGVGFIVTGSGTVLEHSELILPEVLALQTNASWSSAMLGKWHLGAFADANHMNVAGYPHFAGTIQNLYSGGGYYNWVKVTNGSVGISTTYATTDTVDDALAWTASAPEPWFCVVSFNAPHDPFHAPPANLHSVTLPDVDPREMPRPFYKAAVEAMDTEMGRLLAGLRQNSGPTNVLFFGDNGTPKEACVPPFLPEHSKMTLYEGGVNVPLIISGPAVPVAEQGAWSSALVNTSDLFATILDLAGASLPPHLRPEDSISMVPYLSAPGRDSIREYVFAERFRRNGYPFMRRMSAVRGERYKLIRASDRDENDDELYDLLLDRYEEHDLLDPAAGPLSTAESAALVRLREELDHTLGL